jgi:hypothetical protein
VRRKEKRARKAEEEKKAAAQEGAADDVKLPADKKLDATIAKLKKSHIDDIVMFSSEEDDE